jgi:prepilin-type N-terminal cleavage/methylation domain-containing protein
MRLTLAFRPRRVGGFTLVEMMVALALGLIVSAAVIALVVAIIRSNRHTLQTTRLNQELRATLSVIANDMKRARSVDDPLTSAMLVGGNPFRAMDTATAGCMVYAYANAVDGPWHIVRLDNGRVVLEGANAEPANCTPGGVSTAIGSDQVEITALTFTPTTTSNVPPLVTDETVVREFTVTITGHLVDDDASLAGVNRTMSQTVYVRSVGTGI